MVVVVEDVEGVERRGVDPRVVGRRRAEVALVVEPYERCLARLVVVDDVEDDGHPEPVRGVDEGLERVGRAVVLVEREVVVGVVAPRLVAVELGDGHQLKRRHAEALEVGQRVADGLEVVAAHPVADDHLVDHEVLGRGADVAGRLPDVRLGPRRERGDELRREARGVRRTVRERDGRDERVRALIQNQRRVGVRHAEHTVDEVLEADDLARRETRQLDPPARSERVGRVAAEHVGVLDLPVREVADGVDEALARRAEHERRARRVAREQVDSVDQARGHRRVHDDGRDDADGGLGRPPERVRGDDAELRAGRDRRGQRTAEDARGRVEVREAVRERDAVDLVGDGRHGLRAEDPCGDVADLLGAVLLAGGLEDHRVRDDDFGVAVRADRPLVERVRDPRPAVAGCRVVGVVVDLVGVRLARGERLGVAVLVEPAVERHQARGSGRDVSVRVRPPVVDRARRHRAWRERAHDGRDDRRRQVRQEAERDGEGLRRGRRRGDGRGEDEREQEADGHGTGQ